MIRTMSFLHRLPGVSPEDFVTYWHEEHAPRALSLPGLIRFRTNVVIKSEVPQLRPDVVGETWWPDEETRLAAMHSAERQLVLASGAHIIEQSRNASMVLEEGISSESDEATLTRNSPVHRALVMLHRRFDVTPEVFRRRWHAAGSDVATGLAGAQQLARHVVLESLVDGLHPDAIGELFFDSQDAESSPKIEAFLGGELQLIDESRTTVLTLKELGRFEP